MNLEQELKQFWTINFPNLIIRAPLFYNWENSVRFDLQVGSTDNKEYFREVLRRSSTLFEEVFNFNEKVVIIFQTGRWKRDKIRKGNFLFKQINNLNNSDITYTIIRNLYDPRFRCVLYNRAIVKTTTNQINHKNILSAISNQDFGKEPTIRGEVYFVNFNKKMCFHMYDDRGLDIIAADKETLKPIYDKFNDWILEYDRKLIEDKFK